MLRKWKYVKFPNIQGSNSKYNGFETEKRPEKQAGGPVGWEKAPPPLPLFFPPPPHPPVWGLFSAPLCTGIAAKKQRMEKNGQIPYMEGSAELSPI
jgi:hypothetical protein